jgi:ATP phosphoribosyltransferase
MLRVAVPNKGTLAEPAATMLREAGYRQRQDGRELVLVDPDNGVEFFFLRPRDVATYVAGGSLDVGITGRDLLRDGGGGADEVLALGFGRSTFRYAAPVGALSDLSQLAGRRIATSYAGLVTRDLAERGLTAEVVHLDGAVENAVRLGVAEVVADVVDSGTTLRQAGLEVVGPVLLESEAVLVRRADAAPDAAVDQLVRRLQGVIIARRYVMVEYDVRRDALDDACAITPGLESPTISPLQDPAWAAVRAMVPRADAQTVMERLWELGARGVIVTDILACRL